MNPNKVRFKESNKCEMICFPVGKQFAFRKHNGELAFYSTNPRASKDEN